MHLNTSQVALVTGWVAEGLDVKEINARAAAEADPFVITRQALNYYRRGNGVKQTELAKDKKQAAAITGLAIKDNRIKKLIKLARLLETDLIKDKKLWVKSTYETKSGGTITRNEFNGSEVLQFRGILDDIAKEVGERSTKISGTLDTRVKVIVEFEHDEADPH